MIQSTYEFWKEIEFPKLLKELDVVVGEISEDQNQSEASRKVLIEKNRKFKEQVSIETRKEVAPLLKSFQNEVDSLNKRNKSLETHILSLYKKLIDLPDPVPGMEQALANQKKMQKSQDIVLENKRLRENLEEYQKEFSEVKNQEVTLMQLRERCRELEASVATGLDAKFRDRETDLERQFADKERELLQEAQDCQRRIADHNSRLKLAEKALLDCQSELFQTKLRYEESLSAKSTELDLLISENDRMSELVTILEGQRRGEDESLASAVTALNLRSQPLNDTRDSELQDMQADLATKENEIVRLGLQLREVGLQLSQTRSRAELHSRELQLSVQERDQRIVDLLEQLRRQADYEEIKRDLDIIKAIEFTVELAQDDGSDTTRSLEHLLMAKNRRLQSEILQERSDHDLLKDKHQLSMEQMTDTEQQLQQQRSLNDRLEDDLHHIKTFTANLRGSGEGASAIAAVGSPTMKLQSQEEASILATVLGGPQASPEQDQEPNSLLSIVQSQRDRFKRRALDLEEELQLARKQAQALHQDVQETRNDNVKMYEKVRFLESYDKRSEPVSEDGVWSRYANQYEAYLNPFETFHRRERQRQYQSLPVHEKIMFSLGRFVLGNRTARLLAFLYAVLLHFLIFVVLYKLAGTENCVRDQALQCQREFAEHMQKVHKTIR